MFCQQCGAQIDDHARFCPHCGKPAQVPATGGRPPTRPGVQPHRGAVVLTLGILGLAVCVVCGIIAWAMASKDLREMEAGQMDPSGMGLTKAGKICGMISTILNLVAVGIWLLMVVGFGLAGVAAAGAAR